jgi:hypothetical protein
MNIAWMAWTPVTAAFFTFIVLMLISMTIWQIISPSIARRGFLPLVTTRGRPSVHKPSGQRLHPSGLAGPDGSGRLDRYHDIRLLSCHRHALGLRSGHLRGGWRRAEAAFWGLLE